MQDRGRIQTQLEKAIDPVLQFPNGMIDRVDKIISYIARCVICIDRHHFDHGAGFIGVVDDLVFHCLSKAYHRVEKKDDGRTYGSRYSAYVVQIPLFKRFDRTVKPGRANAIGSSCISFR